MIKPAQALSMKKPAQALSMKKSAQGTKHENTKRFAFFLFLFLMFKTVFSQIPMEIEVPRKYMKICNQEHKTFKKLPKKTVLFVFDPSFLYVPDCICS